MTRSVPGRRTVRASDKPRVEDVFADYLSKLTGFAPIREFVMLSGRRWRWDLAYPSQKLVIDIQGRFHRRIAQSRSDMEKHNAAVEAGFKVLLFPADKILSASRIERCGDQVWRILCGVFDEAAASEVLTGEL